jgi:hypothetical protein
MFQAASGHCSLVFFFHPIHSFYVDLYSVYPFSIRIAVNFIVFCVEFPVTCLDSPVLFFEIPIPRLENKALPAHDMTIRSDFPVSQKEALVSEHNPNAIDVNSQFHFLQ